MCHVLQQGPALKACDKLCFENMENFILLCKKKKDFSESEIGYQQLDIRALKKSENRKPGATSLFHSNLDLNANKVAKPAIIAQRPKLQGFCNCYF